MMFPGAVLDAVMDCRLLCWLPGTQDIQKALGVQPVMEDHDEFVFTL